MFSSEQEKMQHFKHNLGLEARNQQHQKNKLDEWLLAQKGIETQEQGLSNFAAAIGEAVSKNISNELRPIDKSQRLPQSTVDDMGTVVKPRRVKTRGMENDVYGTKSVVKPKIIPTVPSPGKTMQTNTPLEKLKMGREDTNLRTLVPKSKTATPEQIESQRLAQANLDLISLFQQDVKEGRKRQAIIDLQRLNADEDRRIRQNFVNVLDELYDKTQSKRDRELLNTLMDAIEKQRMADAFQKFSENAIYEEYRRKLGRNIIQLISNKRTNNIKAYRMAKEQRKMMAEDTWSPPIIKERTDSDTTDKDSVAGFDFGDKLPRGRPAEYSIEDLKDMIKKAQRELAKKDPKDPNRNLIRDNGPDRPRSILSANLKSWQRSVASRTAAKQPKPKKNKRITV